jgi:Domain of unknown function (DUF1905)
VVTDLAAIAAEFGDDPGGTAESLPINHIGSLWRWKSAKSDAPAAWFFVTIDGDAAVRIKSSLARRRGFGSIKVSARIGATVFQTSLFPSNETGGYLLPVKAAVRKAEGLVEGPSVALSLTLLD